MREYSIDHSDDSDDNSDDDDSDDSDDDSDDSDDLNDDPDDSDGCSDDSDDDLYDSDDDQSLPLSYRIRPLLPPFPSSTTIPFPSFPLSTCWLQFHIPMNSF